jgi:GDPmannose 4,6-dehydratase
MLQQDHASDYVVGTGESHTVREFVELAFEYAGVEIEWSGQGVDEIGVVGSVDDRWKETLRPGTHLESVDPKYFRPTEVDYLCADLTKTRSELGWEPKIRFHDLVKIMLDFDLEQVGIVPPLEGLRSLERHGLQWTASRSSLGDRISNEVG